MQNTTLKENEKETEKFLAETNEKEEDIIEKIIGASGRWQIAVFIMACLVKFPAAWLSLSFIFLAPSTSFTCVDNKTDACSQNCSIYEYDRTIFAETIITQWNLVCSKAYLANMAQSVTMAGLIFGNFLFGYFSDKFGRRIPLIVAVLLQIVSGIGAAISSWFPLFALLRFFAGLATGGTKVISLVLITEIVGSKWRTNFGAIWKMSFSFGVATLPLFAYILRRWYHMHIAIFIPSVLLLLSFLTLQESLRWFLTVGRKGDAIKALEKIARHNKRQTQNVMQEVNVYLDKKENRTKLKGKIFDLLRIPILRTYTICVAWNWFASTLCSFTMFQNIGRLDGNIFINVALSGLVQIPGTLFAIWSLRSLGRKNTYMFCHFVISCLCFVLAVVPSKPSWIRMFLSCFVIFLEATSRSTSFIYSGELFLTILRNTGVGTVYAIGMGGSIVAPFVAGLASTNEWLPMVILGVMVLIGAVMCLKLPKTLGQKLPDTVEEAEQLKTRKVKKGNKETKV